MLDFIDVSPIDVMNLTPEQCRASIYAIRGVST